MLIDSLYLHMSLHLLHFLNLNLHFQNPYHLIIFFFILYLLYNILIPFILIKLYLLYYLMALIILIINVDQHIIFQNYLMIFF